MQTDINNPKSKSVNICFQNLKQSFSIVVFVFVATKLMQSPDSLNGGATQNAIQLNLDISSENNREFMYNQYDQFHYIKHISNNSGNSHKFLEEDQENNEHLAAKKGGSTAAKGKGNSSGGSGSGTAAAAQVEDPLTFGNCSDAGKSYLKMIQGGSLVIFFVNLILLFYIWCRVHFARTEFWGTYLMNLVWSGLMILFTIGTIGKVPQECPQIIMAQKSILFLTLKKEFEVLFLGIFSPREFSTRQTNFASNLLFPFLYLMSGDLSGCSNGAALESQVFEVCFIHIFVLLLGSAFNFAMLFFKGIKNGQVFKFYVLLGMLVMLVIYAQNFSVGSSWNNDSVQCTKGKFIQQAYLFIAPLSMVSMMLILCTIRPDTGEDQRSQMLNEYQKNLQHEDYVYNVAKTSSVNPQEILQMHQNQNKQMELTKSYGTIFKK